MKYVLFLYSPYSGDNRILNYLDPIIDKYQRKGFSIIPYRITDSVDVEAIFKSCKVDVHHILIAGGDGTVNHIVNAMMRCSFHVPIATLPAGTANDFAHVLGYPVSILQTCDMILEGEIIDVDLGLVNDRYFLNVLSAGLMTEVSQKTPTILKNTFGKLAYYMSSIQELPRFRKLSIKVDSETVTFDDTAIMFFVFNGRTAGNMNLAYYADVTDGLLDVLIVRGRNIVDTIGTVFHFASGLETSYPKGVVYFKAKSITISGENDTPLDIDGEQGPSLPVTIKCLKGGIKVVVPTYNRHGSNMFLFRDIKK